MKLGQLIKALEQCDPKKFVQFDFCRCTPTTWHSCRGDYGHLAVSWQAEGNVTVADFLKECRAANGATYTGYKGGEYAMGEYTTVGVDNYGTWTATKIVGVRDIGYVIIIDTRNED